MARPSSDPRHPRYPRFNSVSPFSSVFSVFSVLSVRESMRFFEDSAPKGRSQVQRIIDAHAHVPELKFAGREADQWPGLVIVLGQRRPEQPDDKRPERLVAVACEPG